MTKRPLAILLALCLPTLSPAQSGNQPVNAQQQITLQGLRTSANQGKFIAAAYASDGSLILLYDQHDGIRLLKTNATATTLIAQSQQGAPGDSALAIAIDPSGNIYVTGTSTSSTLTGTSGTAFPTRYDTTTNSFLAKYDANLTPLWLTFLGAGATSATSIAATSSGVFVTGLTYSQTFPITSSAIQQTPSPNGNQNGFAEAFTTAGTLTYATYLNGANGNTTPTGIAADANGNAYITGSTTATGFPTLNALVPNIPNTTTSTTSGFLTALNPTGSAFLYSTFIPGTGLTSIALDPTTQTLLLTGNIAPGQFPIATVTTPLVSTPYQSLLRIPLNGQSVTASTLLIPGTQSFVTPGPTGDAWITGTLTTPLFPGSNAPNNPSGDTFLLHLTAINTIDQTLRFGGLPINNALYASLTTTPAAPAVTGTSIALPATLTATAASSLLTTQTFDVPFTQTPNTILPNTLADTLPTTTTCPGSSQCTGTAALLALIGTGTSAPSLNLSTDNLPNLTLRNLGSASATSLSLTATGYTLATNCPTILAPSNSCTLALTGTGPGTLTASAANAASTTINLPATALTPNPIALSTNELDFGIAASTSPAITRTLTLTNLTATPQPFTAANAIAYASSDFSLTATTCNTLTALTIPANSTCTLTFALTASTTSDTPESAFFLIANQDIKLTGFSQVNALNLSSTEIDFGTQYSNATSLFLPRYLYLSNNSSSPITHTPVTLPTTSPFTVTDDCPNTLAPHSICALTLTYNSPTAPSDDSTTLNLDGNQTVLVTGQTLPPATVTGSTPNPSLTVSATAITFATPVTVTGISGTQQSITVTNSGAIPFALTPTVTGDFTLTNTCPATLSAAATCQLFLNFAPAQPGQRDGLLSLTAGSDFSPTLITLTGIGSAILPANNGTLPLGQTYTGEPTEIFLPITQSLPSLTATTNNSAFNIAIVPNTGTAPTSLPSSSFTPTATANCTSCYLGIQFLSQTAGPSTATLTLTTISNGNPYQLTLTGTALPVSGLLLTPITQDFGSVPVNSTSATQTFTLANLLTPSTAVTITAITATGDFTLAPNTTGGPSCAGTLTPTATCYLQLLFTPAAEGPRTGTLTITTSNGIITAPLTGYATPDPGLSISPTSLNFNLTPDPSAITQTITLNNTGTATLTISTPTTSTPNFTSNTNCSTLAPAATCTITVNFAPSADNLTDTLSITVTNTQNGQSTTYTVPLTGNYTTQNNGLQILPTQINFGSNPTETLGYTRQFSLTNLTAKQQTITLTMPRQFPLTDGTACTTLAPNATCTFTVSFLPATNGSLTGTVTAQGTPTGNSAPVQSLAYMLGYGAGSAALTVTGNPIPNSPLSFGQLTSSQTSSQTLTLTNSGTTSLTIRHITSNPPFLSTTTCGATLTPTSSCTVTLTYSPIYELPTTATDLTPRADSGQLLLESDAATSPTLIPLTGSVAPILSSSPPSSAVLSAFTLSQNSLTFPSTAIGNTSSIQTVTFTNTGTTILHVTSVTASTDFTITSTCATLAPGDTCTLSAQFTPTTISTTTARSGTLEISSDASTNLEFISLFGISSASPLTLSPTTLNFGAINIGTSNTLNITATNTTATPITFLTLTTSGSYAVSNSTCNTLTAGATCTIPITFTPTTTATTTGTLSITTNATALPLTLPLTGSGITAPPSFTLTVNGAAAQTLTVTSGSPATYTLELTPLNNFSGPIALTCAPVIAAQYASCSLLSSTLSLDGAPQFSTATINTITTTTALKTIPAIFAIFLTPALFFRRKHRKTLAILIICAFTTLSGCGSNKAPSSAPTNFRYTPAGTYQYTITATSTSGPTIASTVTLNLIVQ
jgi:hypothetical protein